MSIADNLQKLNASLPEGVKLVAVSKNHPVEAIREAYAAGQRIFGESRAQELAAKRKVLPDDIEWHFIGGLQSNKVKEIAPFISMIHSVASLKVLRETEKQAARTRRRVRVLLEIKLAAEESKQGLTPEECRAMLASLGTEELPHVRIAGLMTVATNTDDTQQIRQEFHRLKLLFDSLKTEFFAENPDFTELSMGMSDDYPLAIAEGSTLVRVGTRIFGQRDYSAR